MSNSDRDHGNPQPPKLRITYRNAKHHRCYFCDSSNKPLQCNFCDLAFCYAILEDSFTAPPETDNPQSTPCLTVPRELVGSRRRQFRCPECLSMDEVSLPEYTINRGARTTRRIAIRTSLALVVYHLDSLEAIADGLVSQILAALGALDIHIVTCTRPLLEFVNEDAAKDIVRQLLPMAPFHLAVIFVTESDPRGGWWVSSGKGSKEPRRANEDDFLEHHLSGLSSLAAAALTARVFGASCGLNLFNDLSLGRIHFGVNIRTWLSITIPSAPSLLPWQYLCIFPEMFMQLYYFGTPFIDSVLRTWAKSPEARQHTGLIIMERASWRDSALRVRKFEHAPHSSRPFGFPLPLVPAFCGCWHAMPYRWNVKSAKPQFGEHFYFYQSQCCSFELYIAIYPDKRTVFAAYGTFIMEEEWDKSTERFTFDPATMVVEKWSPRRMGADVQSRPKHEAAWTQHDGPSS